MISKRLHAYVPTFALALTYVAVAGTAAIWTQIASPARPIAAPGCAMTASFDPG
jgi:hypothetical protein